jgi:hypothetical protein
MVCISSHADLNQISDSTCSLIPQHNSFNNKSTRPVARQRKPQNKTLVGHSAVNAISRFSNDILTSVANRYTKKGGMMNIAQDVSRLMATINTEDKHVDGFSGSTTVNSTTSAVLALPTTAQGTSSSTRTGDSILINRIDMELYFQYSGTAATSVNSDQHFRYWLVRYLKTPASSGLTPFSISEFLNTDSFGNYSPASLPNTDTNENFQVMTTGDVNITLPTLATAQLNKSICVPVRHNCHFHQLYNSTTAASVCNNTVFLVVVALNSSNTAGSSIIVPSYRLWYIDN